MVIGAGPNGLVAACVLAEAGLSTLVLERHPRRAGGAVASEAATLPGYLHDVGAAFFPFASASPAFAALRLDQVGLRFAHAEVQSCHPAPDGSAASIYRDDDLTARSFGGADGDRWRRVMRWHRRVEPRLLATLLGPLPSFGAALRLGPLDLLRFAAIGLSSGAGLARRWFQSEAARRVLPGLALHVDLGPHDPFSAALGYMLGTMAASGGNAVPLGGAQAVTRALLARLNGAGGRVRLGAEVARIDLDGKRARGVRLADGEQIAARRVILANTDAAALFLRLLPERVVSGRLRRAMGRFRRGWGTFKVDWALDGPVPWTHGEARRAAVVHAGDSLADLACFTAEVRGGALPSNPYLVIGQQSLVDPSRAPEGGHTLWAYSRVPPTPAGGWASVRERFADQVEARIERLAPGFRTHIRARRVVTPPDLEAMNPNLVGGDLGGGSNGWRNQLLFRPVFPYFRYRTPVEALYLCSSYAHPGAGVHGMCGFNAARVALTRL